MLVPIFTSRYAKVISSLFDFNVYHFAIITELSTQTSDISKFASFLLLEMARFFQKSKQQHILYETSVGIGDLIKVLPALSAVFMGLALCEYLYFHSYLASVLGGR